MRHLNSMQRQIGLKYICKYRIRITFLRWRRASPIPAGTAQYHINADIIYAIEKYCRQLVIQNFIWAAAGFRFCMGLQDSAIGCWQATKHPLSTRRWSPIWRSQAIRCAVHEKLNPRRGCRLAANPPERLSLSDIKKSLLF